MPLLAALPAADSETLRGSQESSLASLDAGVAFQQLLNSPTDPAWQQHQKVLKRYSTPLLYLDIQLVHEYVVYYMERRCIKSWPVLPGFPIICAD